MRLNDVRRARGNAMFAAGCLVWIVLVVLAVTATALIVYALYWVLGYFFEWPWYIKLVLAVVGLSLLSALTGGARR